MNDFLFIYIYLSYIVLFFFMVSFFLIYLKDCTRTSIASIPSVHAWVPCPNTGEALVPSTDEMLLVQASAWFSWHTCAHLLVRVWEHVKPACTSSSLRAFPFLQRALDSTLPLGLILWSACQESTGRQDRTSGRQGPEVTHGSSHLLRLSQALVLMQLGLSLLLTKRLRFKRTTEPHANPSAPQHN